MLCFYLAFFALFMLLVAAFIGAARRLIAVFIGDVLLDAFIGEAFMDVIARAFAFALPLAFGVDFFPNGFVVARLPTADLTLFGVTAETLRLFFVGVEKPSLAFGAVNHCGCTNQVHNSSAEPSDAHVIFTASSSLLMSVMS